MSDQVTPNSFKKFLGTLLNHLCKYDAGYGLYYFVQKHFASPLNHDCRIYRLKAQTIIVINSCLAQILGRSETCQSRKINRFRALRVKMHQELQKPMEEVIVL